MCIYIFCDISLCKSFRTFTVGRIYMNWLISLSTRRMRKITPSLYFRYAPKTRIAFEGYIRNMRELRLECSAYYCVLRLDSAAGGCARFQMSVLKSPSARARMCPAVANGWKSARAYLSFLLTEKPYSFFFFFLLYFHHDFFLLFFHSDIYSWDRSPSSSRETLLFRSSSVAIHSRALRSCPRSDQTRK